MMWNRFALAACAAPAVLVLAATVAVTLLPNGLEPLTVAGAAATASVMLWALGRLRALYGVALCLVGAEGVVGVLRERGVIVSREKALEISAGIMEAKRVAALRKEGA